MKILKKITGLLLILTLSVSTGAPIAHAAITPEGSCKQMKPNYEELMKIWTDAEEKNQDAYKEAFEEAQLAHHDYVGCMFHVAEATVIKSDLAESGPGTLSANLANTATLPLIGLINWNAPDEACLTGDELKKIIQTSEPTNMLGPVLQAHADYKNHLNALAKEFEGTGTNTDDAGNALVGIQALNAKAVNLTNTKRQRQLEIDSSLLAIDLMFTSLKELRLNFVMHVHFQCTLKFLEKYRKSLEDLRSVIEPLPAQLEDASITK